MTSSVFFYSHVRRDGPCFGLDGADVYPTRSLSRDSESSDVMIFYMNQPSRPLHGYRHDRGPVLFRRRIGESDDDGALFASPGRFPLKRFLIDVGGYGDAGSGVSR